MRNGWLNLILLLLGVYLFVCSLSGLKEAWVTAFAAEGKEEFTRGQIERVAGNPLSSLCLGILATALVQSSSAVVAVAIASVAAGGLSVHQAIPLIMGANIGTTVTSVLIALGHSFRRVEFERAVPVALVNDVFKTLNVAVFFVLEVTTGLLSRASFVVADFMGGLPVVGGLLGGIPDFIDVFTNPVVKPSVNVIVSVLGRAPVAGLMVGVSWFIVLLVALGFMERAVQSTLRGRASTIVDRAFKTPRRGVLVGSAVTWVLQSSSVATALAVPFVASGVVEFRRVYPYILGCNIGTTIDPGQIISYLKFGVIGLQVGLVHVLLNVLGVAVWLRIPYLRELPIHLTLMLSNILLSVKNGALALIAFTALTFYIIPLLVIYLS